MRYKYGFRILDYDPEKKQFKTLFHGINGTRILPINKFVKAKKKRVSDGKSTTYISGFHVFPNVKFCLKYSKRFGKRTQRAICVVRYTGNRTKEHSNSGVILADRMCLPRCTYIGTLEDFDKDPQFNLKNNET